MNFKKILAFLLAAQMLLVSLASCGGNGGSTEETKKTTETKAPETAAPNVGTAPETPAEDGGNNIGLIIGIAAAVVVVGAIAGVVIAKKKK